MIEFGKSLREAREKLGMNITQLAEVTRLAPSVIRSLENEDFSHIAAPIYGRGFVKLYCQAVGLEPKEYVDEFMEIINGNREQGIRERVPAPVAAEPPPKVEPVMPMASPLPEPEACEPPPKTDPLAFRLESEVVPATRAPNFANEEPMSEPTPTSKTAKLSRYVSPLQQRLENSNAAAFWRPALLIVAALAIVVAIGFGICALYRATSGGEGAAATSRGGGETGVYYGGEGAAATVRTGGEGAAATSAAEPRRIQKIPPLYMD